MNSIASIILEDINVEDNEDLLKMINRIDDSVKVQFNFQIDTLIDMFNYYIEKEVEHIEALDDYDVFPTIYKNEDNDELYFSLGITDDEDETGDIKCLLDELRRQFGINFANDCTLSNVLRILLLDCADYDIIGDIINMRIYYDTYKVSWIKDFVNNIL